MTRKTPDINKILRADPRSSRYGAPMGCMNNHDDPEAPLYVQKVRMVDGAYAPDGTYWGCGTQLWCAFSEGLANAIYVRARTRAKALEEVLEGFPEAIFVRP